MYMTGFIYNRQWLVENKKIKREFHLFLIILIKSKSIYIRQELNIYEKRHDRESNVAGGSHFTMHNNVNDG